VRATTTDGEQGAVRIFEIYRKTVVVTRTPAITQNLARLRDDDKHAVAHRYDDQTLTVAREVNTDGVRAIFDLVDMA
jgi:hypothetical protein